MENYYQSYLNRQPAKAPRKGGHTKWVVLAVAAVVLLLVLALWAVPRTRSRMFGPERIDVLTIEGTIQDTGTSDFFSAGVYNHAYVLDTIDSLMSDHKNRGLVLAINSPGGGVYETDEVYLKLLEYKEQTGRPIYASFGAQAASGGYYIAMASDKIFCNRNCLTGSIGVRMGTMLDVTGLLEKLGIRSETVTAGKNKAMGDPYTEMTPEQKEILQSYVDEAYEQFIGIVDAGRPGLELEQVRQLADGRIYSAQQALRLGLVDEIGTLEDAIDAIVADNGLEYCDVYDLADYPAQSLFQSFFYQVSALRPKNQVESALEFLRQEQAKTGYYCPALG